jgi:hypothetical protein
MIFYQSAVRQRGIYPKNVQAGCPITFAEHDRLPPSFLNPYSAIPPVVSGGFIQRKAKRDARLNTSDMTCCLHHPCRWLTGIHQKEFPWIPNTKRM